MENVSLSGCKLEIDGKVIIKSAGSPKYNSRLRKQAEKQFHFSRHYVLPHFSTPRILNAIDDEIFSFEMEYINGLSFSEFLGFASRKDLMNLADAFVQYFQLSKYNSDFYPEEDSRRLILNKLHSLKEKSEYKFFIDFLTSKVHASSDSVPCNFCHGDFTLSNMIFHDKVYLIDFLDSYIDSYWIDLAKVRQDLYYRWALIYNEGNNLRLNSAFDYLNNVISYEFSSTLESLMFKVVDVINILRIEPYVPSEKKWVIRRMLRLSDLYEEFNNSNLR